MVRDPTPVYVRGNCPAHLRLGPGSQPPQPLPGLYIPSPAAQPKQRQGLTPQAEPFLEKKRSQW